MALKPHAWREAAAFLLWLDLIAGAETRVVSAVSPVQQPRPVHGKSLELESRRELECSRTAGSESLANSLLSLPECRTGQHAAGAGQIADVEDVEPFANQPQFKSFAEPE